RVQRRRGLVRHPPRRGPHAGTHERPPRRGKCPVSAAEGDGLGEPRVLAHGRRGRRRRERRGQPRRALEPGLADLRDADSQRRRRTDRRGAQALDEPGLRRDREPPLLQPEDRDAVRRREGLDRQAHRRRQDPLMPITGTHMLLYTPEAEAVRAVLRDVLGWEYVEDHPGWLIFKLPPAEL